MCQHIPNNKPLECTDCAIHVCSTHFSSGNLANCIQRIIREKGDFSRLYIFKTQIEQHSKECNTILSSVCYHPIEDQIIQMLLFIKSCNIRFDKWYMHYAILNKKWNIITLLKKYNCPIRCQHIQSAITSDSLEIIEEILLKYSISFTEKTQKTITEAIIQTKHKHIHKLLIPYMYPPTLRQLITICQNRDYFLLFHSLQKIGLHLTLQASSKCIEILNGHILSIMNDTKKGKVGKIYGIHLNADQLSFHPEKDVYFSKCIDWLEMSPSKRYTTFIQERTSRIQYILDTKICRDEQSVVFSFL